MELTGCTGITEQSEQYDIYIYHTGNHTYIRLVVIGPILTDLWGEVVRCPNTGPGQLHGTTQCTETTLLG